MGGAGWERDGRGSVSLMLPDDGGGRERGDVDRRGKGMRARGAGAGDLLCLTVMLQSLGPFNLGGGVW